MTTVPVPAGWNLGTIELPPVTLGPQATIIDGTAFYPPGTPLGPAAPSGGILTAIEAPFEEIGAELQDFESKLANAASGAGAAATTAGKYILIGLGLVAIIVIGKVLE